MCGVDTQFLRQVDRENIKVALIQELELLLEGFFVIPEDLL